MSECRVVLHKNGHILLFLDVITVPCGFDAIKIR